MSTADTSTTRPRSAAAVPQAWKRFLRAHSALTRQIDADLIASHGLTLSDYEVLLRLSQAPINECGASISRRACCSPSRG